MPTWYELIGQYDPHSVVAYWDSNSIGNALDSGFFNKAYLQFLSHLFIIGKFLFQSIPSILLLVIFLAWWYIVIVKPIRKLTKL